MTQQPPPPPGGWPPQPDSPTQPNFPTPPSGYPPQQPSYQPPPSPPGGGYAPPPPPPNMPYYAAPPPGPENNTTRNVVIVAVVALIAALLIGGFYVASRPAASLPVLIPTAKPSSEPTKTPKATATSREVTPKPTKQAATDEPEPTATPTEVAEATPRATEPGATGPTATEGVPPNPPASAGSSFIAGTEDQGIIVGEPAVIGEESLQQIAVLLQNNTDLVKSYSVKATYLNGDTITVSASGFVSDHLPGSIRVATLFFSGAAPGADDVGSVQIDTMLTEDASTPNGDIAKQVTFGPPTINVDEFFSSIDVQVTNGSDVAASIGVSAAILRDGVLVGTGTGFANDMAAGQTKTASLFVTGDLEETDDLLLSVDTVVPTE